MIRKNLSIVKNEVFHMSKSILFIVFLLFASVADADEVFLECKAGGFSSWTVALIPKMKTARLIETTRTREGRLKTDQEHYRVIFPETETHSAIHLVINRYDGSYAYEIGSEPFGEEIDFENTSGRGVCEERSSRPSL